MFIELVDALRCPVTHEESWLVVAAVRMEARHIVRGTLGCPVCAAEYAIMDGIVDLRRHKAAPQHASLVPSLPHADAGSAMRLAAMLGLTDAQGFAVLVGEWGRYAAELTAIVAAPLLLVDPPDHMAGFPGVSVILSDGLLPLATGGSRATALDGGSAERVASAVRATRARGRIVAPISVSLPPSVRELVRDDVLVVAEAGSPASPLVTLHVRRG